MHVPNRAGLVRRLAAAFVDVLGIAITGLVLAKPLQNLEDALGLVQVVSIDTNADALMVIILVLWGGAWIFPLIEILSGASPGKWVLGLRVRRPGGEPAGIPRRFLRAVLKNVLLFAVLPFGMVESPAAIALCFGAALITLIGLGLMFGPDRRTLHDRLSGTAVAPRPNPV